MSKPQRQPTNWQVWYCAGLIACVSTAVAIVLTIRSERDPEFFIVPDYIFTVSIGLILGAFWFAVLTVVARLLARAMATLWRKLKPTVWRGPGRYLATGIQRSGANETSIEIEATSRAAAKVKAELSGIVVLRLAFIGGANSRQVNCQWLFGLKRFNTCGWSALTIAVPLAVVFGPGSIERAKISEEIEGAKSRLKWMMQMERDPEKRAEIEALMHEYINLVRKHGALPAIPPT